MARTPSVPRRPPGRPRAVPLVVPDPVFDLQPLVDIPPVIDDEVPVPVPVDVPAIAVAAAGEMEQMRNELRAIQHVLRDLLPVIAPPVAAGQPPPPPPNGMLVALMECGFDIQAAEALQRHGMSSIDYMSVVDTTNFTSIINQVSRYRDRNYGGSSPDLPIPAMNGLKGMCMWAGYHKARGSVVTMHKFTQDAHDAFLARYLEMKTEEGKDYGLMKQKLITLFPKNFTTAHFITTEKNLRSYLETQRSPYTKTPLSYLLRPHAGVTPASLTASTIVSTRT
jgi:hypothetical protein